MITASTLQNKISSALRAIYCRVTDKSGGCGASFEALIVADAFSDKRLIERHRMVNEVIEAEMPQIHAFTLKCLTPVEWEEKKKSGEI